MRATNYGGKERTESDQLLLWKQQVTNSMGGWERSAKTTMLKSI